MNRAKEVFKVWAPEGSPWSKWVKPVMFQYVTGEAKGMEPKSLSWIKNVPPQSMLIIDKKGGEGVIEGINVAAHGYIPIPIYNGSSAKDNKDNLIDHSDILQALVEGEQALQKIDLQSLAQPAFLIDSRRMSTVGIGQSVRHDNRWEVVANDMPSATYILAQGIKNIVVRGEVIEIDLDEILHGYKLAGIKIFFSEDGTDVVEEAIVEEPTLWEKFGDMFTGNTRGRRWVVRGRRTVHRNPKYYSGSGGIYYGYRGGGYSGGIG